MVDRTENYCQLLGLDPSNEAKYTPEAIAEKIDKMETKWSNEFRNKQNDTGQRFKYHKLVDLIPDIRRQMLEEPMLRKKVFAEGRKDLEGKCQRLKLDCIILSDGRYFLLPGIIDNFTKRLHWDGVDKKQVMLMAGVSEGMVPKPVSDKVFNAYVSLTTVDAYTPAEMLNALIEDPNLEIKCNSLTDASSLAQIRNAFDLCEKRVNSVRSDRLLDQDSYIIVIRSLKLIIDSDKEFNDLISYGKCNRALEPVMECIEKEYTGQQLTRKYIDELLNIYIRDMDVDMCIAILEAFCQKKKIAANFSKRDSTLIRCPECNNMVPSGANTIFCPYCGKNFKTVCPQCDTAQQTSNMICIKCGFNFKEGEAKAQGFAMNFRLDLQKGMISKAEKDLMLLKGVYATYPSIPSMEQELLNAQSAVNTLKRMMTDACAHDKYFLAKDAGDQIAESYPEVMGRDPDIKQKYQDAVSRVQNAEMYCKKASEAEDKDEMLRLYVSAAEVCPDHPDAKSVLKEYPPQGPMDPVGRIVNGVFNIKFEPPSNSAGVTYAIYREKNTLPTVTETSRPIAEIPSPIYSDKSLEPGVEYYYSVYSKRWGILSREAAHFGPVITLAEVDKVSLEQIDGGLRLMYEKPRGATRVRVWRADDEGSGTGVEIPLNGETVYDDIGLKGGVKYHYLLVAEYETRNKVERSQGVVFSETPLNAPEPVRDMRIMWNKADGTFTAKWGSTNPVQLFRSETKYTIQGNMVKMEDIKSWMQQIKPIFEYADGARFNLPDGTVQYIYPIIPMGAMGIKGNEIMVANLKPFRDVEKTMSNKDCIITMNWPDNAVAAKLTISNNGFKEIDDPNAEIVTIKREEYNEERMIRIPMGRAQKKCISIFAVYKVGTDTINSRGIAINVYSAECRKLRYTLTADRKGGELTINAGEEIGQIPEIVITHVEEGIPLRKEDGEVVWSSEKPVDIANGTCRMRIDLGGMSDVEHMRVFFRNEEYYNLFRFIHPLYNQRRD